MTRRAFDLLQMAADNPPWHVLDVHKIAGVAKPSMADIPWMERFALADAGLRECEALGWLLRHVERLRDPVYFWTLTSMGREALDDHRPPMTKTGKQE